VRDCTKKCLELDVSCPVEDCRQWIDYEEDMNCTLLAVEKHGKMTFREVAKRLGVSFVRIKQIQDKSVASLAKNTLL
jgi:DNA-directed RNA polymerase sigma subunit (sigma70/sigma32)